LKKYSALTNKVWSLSKVDQQRMIFVSCDVITISTLFYLTQ